MASELSVRVGDILEREMPGLGHAIFRKQVELLGMDPENIQPRDLPELAGKLAQVAKVCGGQEMARRVHFDLTRLQDLDSIAAKEGGTVGREMTENLAKASIYAGDWKKAADYIDRLIDQSREAGVHKAISESLLLKASMLKERANYDDAISVLGQALESAKASGDENLIARCHCRTGDVLWYAGELKQAFDSYKTAVGLAEERSDIAAAHIGLAIIHGINDEFDDSVREYKEALKQLDGSDDLHSIARAYNNLGDVYLEQERWEEALEALQKGEEYGERSGWANIRAFTLMNAATALIHLGKLDAAKAKLAEALKIAEGIDSKSGLAGTHHAYGQLYRIEKGWSRMVESYRRAIFIYTDAKIPYYTAQCRLELGQGFMEMGQPAKALPEFLEARDIYEQIKVPSGAERAAAEIARAQKAIGK
jgi:tetratricopeptide (TPR) repeat protein